ncbi:MAG: DUF6268 family outer membrane beta-barrel protein [Verrucomicrobiota bacterium]
MTTNISLCLVAVSLCLIAGQVCAGNDSVSATSSTADVPAAGDGQLSYEFDAEETYVGDGDVERGGFHVRDFDENYSFARFVFTPRIKFGILRLGAAYERFDFGLPDHTFADGGFTPCPTCPTFQQFPGTQIPDTLQAAYFIIGLDTQFSDSILFRIEARPGWFGAQSDVFDGDNFDLQGVIGGTYIYSSTLQFVLGLGIDLHGHYPVLPGGGVRWKFAPQWTLDAVVPTPRLDYQVNKSLTVYGGADIKANTYRVGSNYGDRRFDSRLNNAYMSYLEVRLGLGLDWKVCSAATLTAEGGYIPYRNFDFYRPSVRYHQDGGAPYGSIALHMAF